MPASDSRSFLRELDKKLWTAADKLRSNLDAAVYKHAVLGLILLKYVSDSFAQRQAEIAVGVPPCESASQIGLAGRQIEAMLKDPDSDFFVDPDGYDKPAQYEQAIHRELEERDYYIGKNVFWVPAVARRKTLQDSAKLPAGTEILVKGAQASCLSLTGEKARGDDKATGKMPVLRYKITSTGKLIDDALEAVEKENPKLKNALNRNYTQLQIDPANLAGLIDLIATIPFQHADLHAKDILGHVLQKGAQASRLFLPRQTAKMAVPPSYFTPKSIVSLIVEMIEPWQSRVYDPAMGSGGFFVQSERFIEEHDGTIGDIMVFGQDQRAWGAHLRRAKRARRVRLRRKQPEAAESKQSHHLAAGGDEHGHPRHRLRLRQGTGGHLHPRPAPGPPRRLRHGTALRGSAVTPAKPHRRSSQREDKPSLQHQGMVGRQAGGR